MFPDWVSAHLILGHLGGALVQLAGLELQKTQDRNSPCAVRVLLLCRIRTVPTRSSGKQATDSSSHFDFLLLDFPGHLQVLQLLVSQVQLFQPPGGLLQPVLGLRHQCSTSSVNDATCEKNRLGLKLRTFKNPRDAILTPFDSFALICVCALITKLIHTVKQCSD